MFKSPLIRNCLFSAAFLFAGLSFSAEIKVCLWKGQNPHAALPGFQKKYRGVFNIIEYRGESVILNKVDLEEYITGVLAKEMDSLWPLEALKAQAVLSRTFAMNKIAENRKKNLPYDIENSIYHQVYGATNCGKIEKAAAETKNEVLVYRGEIARVFFHANCGGKTADPGEVWGGSYPAIVSVEDPYCKDTPYYKWEKTFSRISLSRLLGFPGLETISISGRHPDGRVKNLKLYSGNGILKKITSHRMRMAINSKTSEVFFTSPHIIPSTNFSILQKGNSIIFTGRGYGHGVGMCQWGARKMAEDHGKSYREILKHYFKNLSIENLENMHAPE